MVDLKAMRTEAGMTQAQLAAEAKVNRTVITNIENGVAKPSIPTAIALGKILKFNWWKFYTTE